MHGDIKPGNIMISDDDRGAESILVDFGISAETGMHTPAYVPPEILEGTRGAGVDTAAAISGDTYSLALVVLEMLTLHRYFDLMGRGDGYGTRTISELGPRRCTPMTRTCTRSSAPCWPGRWP